MTQPQQQFPQYWTPTAPPSPKTNTMAILSLIFAFVFAPLGIVFGHISLSQLKRGTDEGHGLAMTGLILSYAVVVFWVMFIILFAVALGTASTT